MIMCVMKLKCDVWDILIFRKSEFKSGILFVVRRGLFVFFFICVYVLVIYIFYDVLFIKWCNLLFYIYKKILRLLVFIV